MMNGIYAAPLRVPHHSRFSDMAGYATDKSPAPGGAKVAPKVATLPWEEDPEFGSKNPLAVAGLVLIVGAGFWFLFRTPNK